MGSSPDPQLTRTSPLSSVLSTGIPCKINSGEKGGEGLCCQTQFKITRIVKIKFKNHLFSQHPYFINKEADTQQSSNDLIDLSLCHAC